MSQTREDLAAEIGKIRRKLKKLRRQSLNEETTKAALISPLLASLGWDISNPEEVVYEYRSKSKHMPVDYALKAQRTPDIFIEAKSLGSNLADDKLITQIVNYSVQAGVPWVVLTDGVEYRIFNAGAGKLTIERKLFKILSIEDTPEEELIGGLMLLERSDFVAKRIEEAWKHFNDDRRVKLVLERLMDVKEIKDRLVGVVYAECEKEIPRSAVRDALMRATITVEFPPAPDALDPSIEREDEPGTEKARKAIKVKRSSAQEKSGSPRKMVTLEEVLKGGGLKAPVKLLANYLGHELEATIRSDAKIEMGGEVFNSLSLAAGYARKPHFEGKVAKGKYPPTNGWEFWRCLDPKSGAMVPLSEIRSRI
jgi:hypothetical protein